jgi:hypothetical protein
VPTRQLSAALNPTTDVAFPVMDSALPVPHWVARRGSDARAYDIAEAREVYGPAHPFASTSDIRISNGLLRVDVGIRGAWPVIGVWAYAGGAWRAKGWLYLSVSHTLAGARLASLTPERAVVVLSVAYEGPVTIRLLRGSRGLRITHGSARSPAVDAYRLVAWRAAAPVPYVDPTTGWGHGPYGSGAYGGTASAEAAEISGSALVGGRLYEATTDGGSTRVTDPQGLTRGLGVLRSGAVKAAGLGIQRFCRSYELGAWVATTAYGDDLADYHNQLAMASEQMTRMR